LECAAAAYEIWFVVEVVDGLDLRRLEQAYGGRGSAAYHPALLLCLLVYGYARGVFSSRKIERATFDSVAFRFIAAGSHPDHDTLATFRRRFMDERAGIFLQVLELAQEMKLLKLGAISLDGTKVYANASRHTALSHGHIEKIEAHLKAEVQELLALAEQADRRRYPMAQACRPRSSAGKTGLQRWQRPRPRSQRGRKSALSASRRRMQPKWPSGRRRPKRLARNPGASHRSRRYCAYSRRPDQPHG
jgi:transposase